VFKKSDKVESFIGRNSRLSGELTMKGTLRLDGTLEGSIEVDSIVMGPGSLVTGDLRATRAVIGGEVRGDIYAAELVEIKQTGKVRGDIATTRLVVVEGGGIDGLVTMRKDESKIIELSQEKARAHRA
jgi:cytoskeletal protein CcmA (bactofilin family)